MILRVIALTVAGLTLNGGDCPPAKLKEIAPFPVGTAVNTESLKYREAYWTTAIAQFSSFTPEKILKPRFVHPAPQTYDFREADQLMAFCAQNRIRLHGHALVWHRELPSWLEKFKGDSAAWRGQLREHVVTVVSHCKAGIHSWDVVNEAFDDGGALRENLWLKHLGPSYIALAFRYAREADPDAILFYNDYSLENNSAKLRNVLHFLDSLKAEGVPVDGIGMQMHVTLTSPHIERIEGAAAAVAASGYLIHFSELDVDLTDRGIFAKRRKLYAQQAQRYKDIAAAYMHVPAAKRFGITLWGVGDADSWLSDIHVRARPLLFSRSYETKPAFCGFVEGLRGGN